MWLKPEPYEKQFFHTQPIIDIPTKDDYVWYLIDDKYKWMYNKLEIALKQNVLAAPLGICPPMDKVFIRPITNIFGLSNGSYEERDLCNGEFRIEKYKAGYFWSEYIYGTQYTTDIALLNGIVVWYATMETKIESGIIQSFHMRNISIPNNIMSFIKEYFIGYTGIINIEYINTTIIEIHLRMSSQFVDLYGEQWLNSVINLYEKEQWNYIPTPYEGISLVIRTNTPTAIPNVPIPPNISIQKLNPNEWNDGKTIRIAIINAKSEKEAYLFKEKLGF